MSEASANKRNILVEQESELAHKAMIAIVEGIRVRDPHILAAVVTNPKWYSQLAELTGEVPEQVLPLDIETHLFSRGETE